MSAAGPAVVADARIDSHRSFGAIGSGERGRGGGRSLDSDKRFCIQQNDYRLSIHASRANTILRSHFTVYGLRPISISGSDESILVTSRCDRDGVG
ncbi:hypothetical protein EVAR_20732_1 [Eumeta japonica]|uniref:Uncharacterized protein n=1 Tax=Eumeta variegata TaxID=151549 RepID=A0A4C1V9K8_EUMVA|nr:hypothetical protein EVAR_20732_1 [Eumeta japonica]